MDCSLNWFELWWETLLIATNFPPHIFRWVSNIMSILSRCCLPVHDCPFPNASYFYHHSPLRASVSRKESSQPSMLIRYHIIMVELAFMDRTSIKMGRRRYIKRRISCPPVSLSQPLNFIFSISGIIFSIPALTSITAIWRIQIILNKWILPITILKILSTMLSLRHIWRIFCLSLFRFHQTNGRTSWIMFNHCHLTSQIRFGTHFHLRQRTFYTWDITPLLHSAQSQIMGHHQDMGILHLPNRH